MRYKIPLFTILIFLLHSAVSLAQYSISGIVNDSGDNPVVNVEIHNDKDKLLATTDIKGAFSINFSSNGSQKIVIKASGFIEKSLIVDASVKDITITLIYNRTEDENVDFQTISLSDDEVNDGGDDQNVSSILNASKDVFAYLTTFQFNVARFRGRGYNNGFTRMFLNGMPVNDLDDGRVNWSTWGGLNDVLRNSQSTYGLDESEYTFGDIGGTQSIDLRATHQRKQIKPAYSISNRSYRNRAMITYSTGLLNNKYALTVAGSKRWGNEGYIESTFYDGYSYFLSFDYILNKKHALNIVALGAPTKRGGRTATTQEVYDIAGSNFYNSFWGYQNGKKRNSSVTNSFQPIFMLRHDMKISEKIDLTSTVSFQAGRYGSARLDWFNANTPRPDYYRNLPSFYKDNPEIASFITDRLSEEVNRQVDWAYLYFINKNTTEDFQNANDIEGAVQSGHRAKYIMGERRFDSEKINFNSNYKYLVNENLRVNGGLSILNEVNHNFNTAIDLLGADYFVDIDKYAVRDFAPNSDELQNDLNNRNRIVFESDNYGYNYGFTTQQGSVWSVAKYNSKKVDFFAGVELSYTQFWREGFTKNGKFPDNSYGKSKVSSFADYGIKGGMSYKLDGRNYINLIGFYKTKAPYTRYAFISPRTRNDVIPNLKSNKIFSSELSYHHKSPLLKAKASAYFTTLTDQVEVNSFYHDDLRTFVNFILSGIDERHMGLELAADLKLSTTLSVVGVAAIGQYVYTSRPEATISQDNSAELLEEGQTVYQKNFFIPNTPQQAYTIGLKYSSPKFWFLNLNLNYFDEMYLDFNPTRRTEVAVADLVKSENIELWEDIIFQEKVPSNYTVDLFGGKSWKIGQKFIYLTVGINNLLNNKNFKTGGYEQSRFDFRNRDVNRFPPRYFYAYGTNYFIGVSFRL